MINLYGLIYFLAAIICLILVRSYLKKRHLYENLSYGLIISLILGTIIGARLFYCFYYNPSYFGEHLAEILYVWQGGLSFHGGCLGAILSGYLFCRAKKLDFLELADLLIMPIILFLALGRVVNFINSELYGTIATVPWCVEFSNISGCRHPVQVYNALVNLIASLILIFVSIKKPKKGVLLFLGVFLISLFRFSIDFYREYNVYFLGLGIGQYLNIIFAIASLIGLIYIFKKESF